VTERARSRVARKAAARVTRALERQDALPPGEAVDAAFIAQTMESAYFAILGALMALFSRTFYVAVTDTHIFVLTLSAGRRPGKVAAAAPLTAARFVAFRRWPWGDAFEIAVGDRTWGLQSGRIYRSELDVLGARLRG
jgi:hypothetical protein